MKDFIYLDTDYLTSYLSQINDGQIIQKIVSDMEGNHSQLEEATETIEKNTELGGGVSGSIPLTASTEASYSRSKKRISPFQKTTFSEFEFGQSLISKTAHDNAFEELLNYAKNNNLIQNNKVGSYYFGEIPYTLFDLDYFHQLFSSKAVKNLAPDSFKTDIEFALEQQIHSLNDKLSKTNNNSDIRKINVDLKNLQQQLEEQQNNFSYASIIEGIMEFCPTSCFLINNELLIPLRTNFLRDGYKESIFKYSGQVHLFGKITKQVTPRTFSSFTTLQDFNFIFEMSIMQLFNSFKTLETDQPFVVSPVAIYFE